MPQTAAPQKPVPDIGPAFDADALLRWYDRHARNLPWRVGPAAHKAGVRADPYRVWLSEVMLQQTTVAAVRDYFLKFTAAWPTVADLAAAPLDDVLAAWAGLGYYSRARNLYATAQEVAFRRGGVFPDTAGALQELPGIGPYTAAAIAAICFEEPVAVLDGNVDRVMARLLALDKPVRDAKPELRERVAATVPSARPGDFAQAMMDLGATLCAPRSAACVLCPITADCRARQMGEPERFPLKPVKAKRPTRKGHAFLLERADGAVWLCRREKRGVLAQMTGTPTSDWVESFLPEPSFPTGGDWRHLGQVIHVFTHFRLELEVWHLDWQAGDPPAPGWWSGLEDRAGEALPSLFKKVLAMAGDKKDRRSRDRRSRKA